MMKRTNPIAMRCSMLREISQNGFSQRSFEMICDHMASIREESREAEAERILILMKEKSEDDVLKCL